jgi:hypothetical protein
MPAYTNNLTGSHPEDLPPPVAADTGGHDEGLGDDTAAVAHVEIGGVQEQIREPGVIDPAMQELLHRLIDLPRRSSTPSTG